MFTRFVLSFKSLNQVISKDAIKKKFEAACLNSTIKGGDYKNFLRRLAVKLLRRRNVFW